MEYGLLCAQILDIALRAKRGERVWIDGWDHTTDLVSLLAREARKRGCEVHTTIRDEGAWVRVLQTGPESSLKRLSPEQLVLLNEVDSYVFTLGPGRPMDWAGVPARRRGLATIWFLESNPFTRQWMSIVKARGVKMLGIETTLATEERARVRGLDYETWKRTMLSGCLADTDKMEMKARKLSRLLGGRSEVRLVSPSGTDLTFSLDGRPVEISDGKAARGGVTFLPGGLVGTTVDEESAEGTISYDSPILFPEGRTEKLRLRLKRGKITDCEAAHGAGHFRAHLRGLGRGSDRFAYFGIGLNPLLRLGYTQDDKVLGAVELNFGENFSRGGRNRGRAPPWFGVTIRGSLTVGGRRVMERGRLLI